MLIAPLTGPHRRLREEKRAVRLRAELAKPDGSRLPGTARLPSSPAYLEFNSRTVKSIVRALHKDPDDYTFICHSEGHLHTKTVGSGDELRRLWHCWGGEHFQPLKAVGS